MGLGREYAQLSQSLAKIKNVQLVNANPDIGIGRDGTDIILVNGAADLIVRLPRPTVTSIRQRIERELWLEQLLQASSGKANFNVTLALTDSTRGETVVEQEEIQLAVHSEKSAYLLLLHIDGKAEHVNVFYPYNRRELAPIAAGTTLRIPEHDQILVTPPFGTDRLILYAFAKRPPLLDRLMGAQLAIDSRLLKQLERLLTQGDIEVAQTDLRLISVSQQSLKP